MEARTGTFRDHRGDEDGFIEGPDGHRDTIISIEDVHGTQKRDTIRGDANGNGFMGYRGADHFVGRGGSDWASYRNDTREGGVFGIVVKLNKGCIRDRFGTKDTIKSIANVEGSDFGDSFRDATGDNRFRGRDGDDTFVFTRGNDRAEGGNGADALIFRGPLFGDNTTEDFEDSIDIIQINEARGIGEITIADDGADVLITWSPSTIRLEGLAGTTIDANDFILPPI